MMQVPSDSDADHLFQKKDNIKKIDIKSNAKATTANAQAQGQNDVKKQESVITSRNSIDVLELGYTQL